MRMKYLFFAIIVAVCLAGCKNKEVKPVVATTENVQDSITNTPDVEMIKDFTMTSVAGKKVSLKDEVAKHELTIIDFWASWCGPCMHEVPNLVSLYNKYKDTGLGIVGISLDEDEDSWKSAIEENKMSWTQLSDLQGWNNAAARLYGVESIPHILVVNKKGEIIAEDLRGEDLKNFIASQKLQ